MKTKISLLVMAAIAFVLGSCKDSSSEGNGTGHPQGGITFDVGVNELTRAQYASNDWLQVEWTSGDVVKLFCNNTQYPIDANNWADRTQGNYNVTPVADPHDVKVNGTNYSITNNRKGILTAASTTDKLYWKAGPSKFYATFGGDATVTLSGANEGVAKFKYKNNQTCTLTSGQGEQTYIDRSHIFMAAKQSVNEPVDNVDIHFTPIMTTLEVTIQGTASGGSSVNIASMAVTLPKNLDVTYDEGENTYFDYDINAGIVKNAPTGTDAKEETYTFALPGTDGITLGAGQTIKVTALLPPIAIDGTDKVKIAITSNKGDVVASFQNGVSAGTKAKIKLQNWQNPPTPPGAITEENQGQNDNDNSSDDDDNIDSNVTDDEVYATTNAWQGELFGTKGSQYDNVLMSSVSLPGSNLSGTYAERLGLSSSHHYQITSIRQQLAQGIRVFDLHPITVVTFMGANTYVAESDGGSDNKGKYSYSVWNQTVTSGYSYDINKVFTNFLTRYPNEFLIIIIDPSKGMTRGVGQLWDDNDGKVTARRVNPTLKSWSDAGKLVTWKPDLTIDDCRGKIIVMVRNQNSYSLHNVNSGDTAPVYSAFVNINKTTTTAINTADIYNLETGQSGSTKKGTLKYQNCDPSNYTTKLQAFTDLANDSKQNHDNGASAQNIWYLNNVSYNEWQKTNITNIRTWSKNNNKNVLNFVKSATCPLGMVLMDRCGTTATYGSQLVTAIIDHNKKQGVLRTSAGKFYPTTTE